MPLKRLDLKRLRKNDRIQHNKGCESRVLYNDPYEGRVKTSSNEMVRYEQINKVTYQSFTVQDGPENAGDLEVRAAEIPQTTMEGEKKMGGRKRKLEIGHPSEEDMQTTCQKRKRDDDAQIAKERHEKSEADDEITDMYMKVKIEQESVESASEADSIQESHSPGLPLACQNAKPMLSTQTLHKQVDVNGMAAGKDTAFVDCRSSKPSHLDAISNRLTSSPCLCASLAKRMSTIEQKLDQILTALGHRAQPPCGVSDNSVHTDDNADESVGNCARLVAQRDNQQEDHKPGISDGAVTDFQIVSADVDLEESSEIDCLLDAEDSYADEMNPPSGVETMSPYQNLYSRSTNRPNFAWKLVKEIFATAELKFHNCNGSLGKKALDAKKLDDVRTHAFLWYPSRNQAKDWKACVVAIDKGIRNRWPMNKYTSPPGECSCGQSKA